MTFKDEGEFFSVFAYTFDGALACIAIPSIHEQSQSRGASPIPFRGFVARSDVDAAMDSMGERKLNVVEG